MRDLLYYVRFWKDGNLCYSTEVIYDCRDSHLDDNERIEEDARDNLSLSPEDGYTVTIDGPMAITALDPSEN